MINNINNQKKAKSTKIYKDYQRLSKTVKDCQRFTKIVKDCPELS